MHGSNRAGGRFPSLFAPLRKVGPAAAPSAVRRRSRSRRARRAVAWGLFCALALHAGLLVTYLANPMIGDPLFSARTRLLDQRLRSAPGGKLTVLTMGTSRTWWGFDARRFKESATDAGLGRPISAFNFSMPGMGPVTMRLYLKRLRERGVVPELVVIELLPTMLLDADGAAWESNVLADRLTPAEIGMMAAYGVPEAKAREAWWRVARDPWGELRFKLLARVRPEWIPRDVIWHQINQTDAYGWRGRLNVTVTEEERQRLTAIMVRSYREPLAGWNPGPRSTSALRDLLRDLRDGGTTALLVWMPEARPIRALHSPDVDARIAGFLDGVSAEFGTAWVDARTWFRDEDFFDSQHILPHAAEVYTDRLGRDYIFPLLRSPGVLPTEPGQVAKGLSPSHSPKQ
jgi:hypothetical protein